MTQDWAEDLHRRTAAAIKAARGSRPAQWLADETERLGYPISRAAIANYESGRKKGLDVAELIVLAEALRVPPLVLLFPQLPDGELEGLPGLSTTAWNAASWFSGEEDRVNSEDATPPATTKELKLIRAVRERRDRYQVTAQFLGLFADALQRATKEGRNPNIDPEVQSLLERINALKGELNRINEVIRENGGVIDDTQPTAAAPPADQEDLGR